LEARKATQAASQERFGTTLGRPHKKALEKDANLIK
jgi:hypothetical protein